MAQIPLFLDSILRVDWTIQVRLKVSHLLRKLKQIDRDINELNSLQEKIRNDRSYSVRVIESLSVESKRINRLKEQIFSQIVIYPTDVNHPKVKSPIDEASVPVISKNPVLKPEIILPEIIPDNMSNLKIKTSRKEEADLPIQPERKEKLDKQNKYKFRYTR